MKTIKDELMRKRKGFSGVGHLTSSLMLMALCMLLPIPVISDALHTAQGNILLFIVCFFVLGGAALLPDLDNDVSSAGYSLGFFGSIMKGFMKSTATIVYQIFHMKNDRPPKSAHRLMWHAPIIGILLIILFGFNIPATDLTIFNALQNAVDSGHIFQWIAQNAVLFVFILLVIASTLCGSNMILYWPMKILPVSNKVKKFADFVIPILIIFYIFTTSYANIRIIGICIGAGYLFHTLGDLITQGSVPVIWPIPAFWKKQMYWSPWILGPFQIRTGGIINTILNFAFAATAVILFVIAFS